MSASTPVLDRKSRVDSIPPLQAGDRLSRDEFELRYEAMPELNKAELIEGVVHMPSPVRLKSHSSPHLKFAIWAGTYLVATPNVDGGDNGSVRLDLDNEPQPDVFLCIDETAGGQVRIDQDDYLAGAPEWIGEVSASSASYDLHDKLNAYRRNGVREYVVWRVLDRAIDWFVLRGSRYVPLSQSPDGHYQSEVFPGLWLDPAAMIAGDMKRVIEVLQRGIDTPEHAAFVERLQKARSDRQH